MKFAAFAISSNGITFILNYENEKLLEENYKLNLKDRLLLEKLGFLTTKDIQFKILATKESQSQTYFVIGGTIVSLEKPANQPEQQLQVLIFTKIGQELLKLVNSSTNLDYTQLLASKLRKDNYSVKYGSILKRYDNGDVNHSPFIEVPFTEIELKAKEEKEARENKNN